MNRIILPPGWRLADQLSNQSLIVDVAAGSGINATVQTIATSVDIPTGAKAYVADMMFRVLDQAQWDQVFFSLRRNGAALSPWHQVFAEQIAGENVLPIDQSFDAGLIEIGVSNITGTAETGAAPDGVSIRVMCRIRGYLLRRVR